MEQTSEVNGFGALVSLASDIEEMLSQATVLEDPVMMPEEESLLSARVQKPTEAHTKPDSLPQARTPIRWKYMVASAVVLLVLASYGGVFSSPRSPASSSKTPDWTIQNPIEKEQSLVLEKPPIGTHQKLNISQICWCQKEKIRLETMNSLVNNYDSNSVRQFNLLIDDYNARCGSYRYRSGDLETAKRKIEKNRSEIVAQAISDADWLGISRKQPARDTAPAPNSSSQDEKKTKSSLIRDIQKALRDLGYNPGPADGKSGSRTVNAIKAFQRDQGITQDGKMDEMLLALLELKKIKIDK